ncbi:protein of unknown function [Candidatus Methylomirabilis oxygeniifera]|jgi:hypothetical protein|uniref:Uncharacterized protein n=1 Tax=Methylomirabilis oxygeniifera TaxID=671143 RepID=D5MLT5_METO1|nr:protein of unknown function [Candidatus Methylomirabilis oxyfera]
MTAANRQQIAEMIRAYGRATPVLEEERLRWLTQLTPQEARAIYESLYEAWERGGQRGGGDWATLDRWRLETKLAVREAFARLAASRSKQ